MEQGTAAENDRNATPEPTSLWRDEVNARVAGYRNRRGRRIEGAFSMRFPFPPMEPPADRAPLEGEAVGACDCDVAAADVSSEATRAESEGASSSTSGADGRSELSTQPMPAATEATAEEVDQAPRPRRKVIAFPKPLVVDPELLYDDPVVSEQPRILDVPQELPSLYATPLLDGLQFVARENRGAVAAADREELPLKAVRIGQRLYAGVIDCATVFVAAGIFVAAAYKLMPKLTAGKPLLVAAAAVMLLIWAVYQYLFVVYTGRTLGMHLAAIRLSRFDGRAPSFRQRRCRVLALYFSAASLMMGMLWALVDVDGLCWHDRISRTYPAAS